MLGKVALSLFFSILSIFHVIPYWAIYTSLLINILHHTPYMWWSTIDAQVSQNLHDLKCVVGHKSCINWHDFRLFLFQTDDVTNLDMLAKQRKVSVYRYMYICLLFVCIILCWIIYENCSFFFKVLVPVSKVAFWADVFYSFFSMGFAIDSFWKHATKSA